MRKSSIKYDLSAFVGHLTFSGLTPSTAAIYEVRVRAILGSLGLESASEDYLSRPGIVSESALREVLAQYSLSSRTQALCAWRAFVEFVCLDLPKLDNKPLRVTHAQPSPSDLHPLAGAVWALFRPHPTLDPMLVAALRWKHLRWRGVPKPAEAFGLDILDGTTTYDYPRPLIAFAALWDWARGRYEVTHLDQPLIVQDCEGWEPISPDTLLSIHRAGRAGRIPRLLVDVAGATGGAVTRPEPPRAPIYGGGNSEGRKERQK